MPLKNQKLFLFLSCLLTVSLISCGYSNRRADVSLGAQSTQAQRIFVPVVDNLTTRPGLEAILTSSLREALASLRGVEVVDRPESANFFLLGSLVKYERKYGISSVVGSPTTAAAGGLSQDQITAAEINVSLTLEVKLLEKTDPAAMAINPLRKLLWVRSFTQGATFETARRFTEAEGSSSSVHINDSRETLQTQILARGISRQVLDQVVQDF